MKRITCILTGACFILFSGAAMAEDTIKLGVPGAHSGDLASYGLPSAHAAKLVVDDINARGGVMGKKVVILQEDDQCKPEVAANVGTKLVAEKVDVVMGHICSGATKAAMNIYKDAGIITMSPSATNVELTKSGDYPNFFRTISPDDAQALLQVDFALNTLKVSKVAVIHDKGDYGKGLAEFAYGFLEERGAKPVMFEGITPGAVDYSAVVQKIKRSGAEAVIYGGYHPEAAKIVSGMKKKKMDTIFISDDGVRDETFIKVAGKYAEGVYATGPIDTTQSPMAIAAIEQHKKVYGTEPGAFYLNAYSATLCLLQAIDKAGSTEFGAVAEALRTNWFETPLGKISFDEKGDAKGIGFAIYQVQNGQYVEVGK
ncbi:MAG: branched-chain amino acid ABC transporter substrate-binding protein [Desulfomonilia bacterium]|uniref:Leucine-, isoleucine-, valine-, threonine-, and alanine-binding protein n=1 Tax=anaerobic digester metagenome TaxID=1263854 RepID=A0A485LZN0_9ZZZZ|nr:branched-chain amino acid ABC transporter substrate-binding protein [Pseudomonadota bacterium]HON38356.1 branched-chain amino acid ABC transporter substrate-binding protein [Deltaproteobacteria bacterium]HRS56514.1 branched-chain amino acid ABC transporter substrate-binding protein [Desulfomonilia bacterium]HPD21661.1 branched-chain amino acid ABC transporter substrate-binding protein [Deltaproteobacteria bacterium]HPX18319.1 branched-chain amino acid ABC transporter substrate-binding protei